MSVGAECRIHIAHVDSVELFTQVRSDADGLTGFVRLDERAGFATTVALDAVLAVTERRRDTGGHTLPSSVTVVRANDPGPE